MRRFDRWKKQCAVLVLCAVIGIPVAAQTFTTLHSFTGVDGANPYAGLVQGLERDLYGTTIDGGAYGSGNVFRIDRLGNVTSIYDFCAQSNCADGQYPDSTLVMGPDGDFYGTTQNGGLYNYGSVFKISTSGVLTTLHSFDIVDGVSPYGALLFASNGNFFGTTNEAGACAGGGGCGTVFTISPQGKFKTLYNFCMESGCPDGEFPVGGLIEGSDGNIYEPRMQVVTRPALEVDAVRSIESRPAARSPPCIGSTTPTVHIHRQPWSKFAKGCSTEPRREAERTTTARFSL